MLVVVFRKEKERKMCYQMLEKRSFSCLWSFKLSVQWNNLVGDKSLDISEKV
jgi:hypothetical protein